MNLFFRVLSEVRSMRRSIFVREVKTDGRTDREDRIGISCVPLCSANPQSQGVLESVQQSLEERALRVRAEKAEDREEL